VDCVWQPVQLNTRYELAVVWHWAQGALWLLVSGKYEVWLNAEARSQLVSVFRWHVSQVVANPAWGTGVVAPLKSLTWQP
jgi:hypothetical protein